MKGKLWAELVVEKAITTNISHADSSIMNISGLKISPTEKYFMKTIVFQQPARANFE